MTRIFDTYHKIVDIYLFMQRTQNTAQSTFYIGDKYCKDLGRNRH